MHTQATASVRSPTSCKENQEARPNSDVTKASHASRTSNSVDLWLGQGLAVSTAVCFEVLPRTYTACQCACCKRLHMAARLTIRGWLRTKGWAAKCTSFAVVRALFRDALFFFLARLDQRGEACKMGIMSLVYSGRPTGTAHQREDWYFCGEHDENNGNDPEKRAHYAGDTIHYRHHPLLRMAALHVARPREEDVRRSTPADEAQRATEAIHATYTVEHPTHL